MSSLREYSLGVFSLGQASQAVLSVVVMTSGRSGPQGTVLVCLFLLRGQAAAGYLQLNEAFVTPSTFLYVLEKH